MSSRVWMNGRPDLLARVVAVLRPVRNDPFSRRADRWADGRRAAQRTTRGHGPRTSDECGADMSNFFARCFKAVQQEASELAPFIPTGALGVVLGDVVHVFRIRRVPVRYMRRCDLQGPVAGPFHGAVPALPAMCRRELMQLKASPLDHASHGRETIRRTPGPPCATERKLYGSWVLLEVIPTLLQ